MEKLTDNKMTENQEKELFTTLATLVTGVNKIQTDVQGLKTDVQGLKTDVQGLKTDVQDLKTDVQEIKGILNDHSQILKRLDAKTDTIAGTVMNHETRLTKAERDIKELQGGVH